MLDKILTRYRKILLICCVLLAAIIVIIPEFIAGDKEIVIKTEDGFYIPFFMNDIEYYNKIDKEKTIWSIMPIIPYDPISVQSSEPILAAPFTAGAKYKSRHILGTDHLGRDVLSGMIYGFRTALIVGLGATIIALIIGVFFGIISAYYADNPLYIHPVLGVGILGAIITIGWTTYWAFLTGFYLEYILFGIVVASSLIALAYYIQTISAYRSTFPIDSIVQSIADFFTSIPALVLLLAFVPFFVNSSIWLVVVIIGFIRWPSINRYTRAEAITTQSKEWVSQLQRWNMPTYKIMFKYIIKELKAPIYVLAIFSIGSAIVLESTLSFLGLGYGIEHASWGSMMSNAREYTQAWWLIVFPGFAITIIMIGLQFWSQKLMKEQYIQEH